MSSKAPCKVKPKSKATKTTNTNTAPVDSLDSASTSAPSKAHPRPRAITTINAQTVVKVHTEGNLPSEISEGSNELALTELSPSP